MFQAGLDTYVKPEGQNTFCAAAPNCTMIKVPNSKHEIYNEVVAIRLDYWNKAEEFFQDLL